MYMYGDEVMRCGEGFRSIHTIHSFDSVLVCEMKFSCLISASVHICLAMRLISAVDYHPVV